MFLWTWRRLIYYSVVVQHGFTGTVLIVEKIEKAEVPPDGNVNKLYDNTPLTQIQKYIKFKKYKQFNAI